MQTIEDPTQGEEPRLTSDGADPTSSMKQMAGAAGNVVKQEAASFASAAKDKFQTQADEARETASKAIGDFATAIQHASDELAGKDQTMAAHLVKGAADRVGDLARTLSDKRPDEMLQGMREFGRRNPMALAAFGVLAGLAVGRLLRTSVEPLDEQPLAPSGTESAQLAAPRGLTRAQGPVAANEEHRNDAH